MDVLFWQTPFGDGSAHRHVRAGSLDDEITTATSYEANDNGERAPVGMLEAGTGQEGEGDGSAGCLASARLDV